MSFRPTQLDTLIQQMMHPIPGTTADHHHDGARTLASARDFRATATLCRNDGLRLPVISTLHEAARLAITAVATARGLRFANRPGAHIAVVDYAIGIKLITHTQWTQLDELRDLRHKTNYPSDLVEPSDAELDQFAALTDSVLRRAQHAISPIPPPQR